jgi:DeoR family transcriptional regulator, fructose operon transcriptional repressor
MLAEERLVRIVGILNQKEKGIASVAELSEALEVSTMTIRRDLGRLEGMALLRRVHGGALAYQGVSDWKPFTERHEEHSSLSENYHIPAVESVMHWSHDQNIQNR